jgi:hypothetical protein
MLMNADEFIKWFGNELENLLRTTNDTNRFTASRELVNQAIQTLEALPSIERARIQDLLVASYQSGLIGDFRIPFDIREEYDWIEGILATLKE